MTSEPGPVDIARAFTVFPDHDSGCTSFGVVSGEERLFVKRADTTPARWSLERAIALHRAVSHEAVVPIVDITDADGVLTVVYPWRDGVVLNQATVSGSDRTGLRRFQALAGDVVERAVDRVLDAHLLIARAGFVAVDLYDGCFLYDFERSVIWLIDLDEYRPGPFVLDDDRLPGSRRYMAPEQWQRGATIDERTTVHLLGRTLWHLLGSPSGGPWRGSPAQRVVVQRATAIDRRQRYSTVEGLVEAWGQAR